MSGSPEAAIGRLRPRERLARRRIAGLSALAAIGLGLVAIWPSAGRLGVLVTGFAVAAGGVEVGVIALARGRARQAADELIDAGIVTRPGSDARELVDNRLRELGAEPSRRRTAAALRDAITDAGRPRSSNPLILAGRSIVLRRGTALALLADRELALRIARELSDQPANPRAVLALRNLLYPKLTGPIAIGAQQHEAQRQLLRIADLLDQRPRCANCKLLGPRPTAMTCATPARPCATLADVRVETPARVRPEVCAAPALYVR